MDKSNHQLEQWQELILQDDNGQQVMSMSHLDENSLPAAVEQPNISQVTITKLSSMLQGLPLAAVNNEVTSEHYMKIIISSGSKLSNASEDGYFRALVKGADNKIKEHALLQEPKNLSKIINSAMAWQAVSIAVAQKHLADIDKKLEALNKSIDEIKRDLDNERLSKIETTNTSLDECCLCFMESGTLPETQKNSLEHKYTDILASHEFFVKKMEDCIFETSKSKKPKPIVIGKNIADFADLASKWSMTCIVLAKIIYLTKALRSDETAFYNKRSDDFLNKLEKFLINHTRNIDKAYVDQIGSVSEFWASQETNYNTRYDLRLKLDHAIQKMVDTAKQCQNLLNHDESLDKQLIVKLSGNSVSSVYSCQTSDYMASIGYLDEKERFAFVGQSKLDSDLFLSREKKKKRELEFRILKANITDGLTNAIDDSTHVVKAGNEKVKTYLNNGMSNDIERVKKGLQTSIDKLVKKNNKE